MKIEVSPVRFQVRFYDDKGKYLGAMGVEKHGPRAIIDSLFNKSGFYRNFDIVWDYVNLICNTDRWHAHMEPDHFEISLRVLGSRYKVEVIANETHEGREMLWVEVTKPDSVYYPPEHQE